MNILDTKIGTKLEIELINRVGQKIGQTFISQIMDIIDRNNVVIAAPMHESRITYIPIGVKVRLIFIHEKYGLLSFIGTVVKKEKRDNLIEFDITIDSEFENTQRRNFFRLDCVLDAQYRILQNEPQEQDPSDIAPAYKKALTRNLSGCGACIVIDEAIPKDAGIELILTLGPTISVKVVCKVVRSSVIELTKGKKYENGLYFTEISKKDQNSIIKFVFDQQKLLIKKTNPK